MVRELREALKALSRERNEIRQHLTRLGAMDVIELEERKAVLKEETKDYVSRAERARIAAQEEEQALQQKLSEIR